ncbi:hypothetical protein JOC54_004098 [Alkalihalobacillus xiaoxiensis]|uniref:SAM-dependent methyltransferase n=1 Tax=Shouchella xiaoxiensis TaxID=766895 RepID=A0ABS2SZ73_9BACI|nr:class I SAM-dependent methyltransferase [Shouchella xiaoxiensis]MBM7840805.1 hypothetical protein [Shouchella xiaoxiensis]
MNQLSDVAYWAEAWKNDPHSPIKKMKKAGLASPHSAGFIKWAEAFDANSFTAEATKRTERILKWVEQYTGSLNGRTILDVGAASGVFSVPMAKAGAIVTALEPTNILREKLVRNAPNHSVDVSIIGQSFEELAVDQLPRYDLVFASMCPAMIDWDAVQKAIALSSKHVYISLMAGPKKNSLVEELLNELKIEAPIQRTSDMMYVLQLLYLTGYSYQSLIEQHEKTMLMKRDDVLQQLHAWFLDYDVTLTDQQQRLAADLVKKKYNDDIPVITGGRFGKVLITKEQTSFPN